MGVWIELTRRCSLELHSMSAGLRQRTSKQGKLMLQTLERVLIDFYATIRRSLGYVHPVPHIFGDTYPISGARSAAATNARSHRQPSPRKCLRYWSSFIMAQRKPHSIWSNFQIPRNAATCRTVCMLCSVDPDPCTSVQICSS